MLRGRTAWIIKMENLTKVSFILRFREALPDIVIHANNFEAILLLNASAFLCREKMHPGLKRDPIK